MCEVGVEDDSKGEFGDERVYSGVQGKTARFEEIKLFTQCHAGKAKRNRVT